MQRIDGPTAAAALPAPAAVSGTPGYFTGGDPAVPIAPTIVTADFLNMLQEELVAVILGAGLTLDKANRSQLFAAIQALITSGGVSFASDAEAIAAALSTKAVTPHAAGALVGDRVTALKGGVGAALDTLKKLADALGGNPNFAADQVTALTARALVARQIIGAGLAVGGGDLSSDRVITVTAANGAELNGQAEAGKVVTPEAFGAAGGGADGTARWCPLPGGNIMQWGTIQVTGGGTSARAFAINFPRPFLVECLSITGNSASLTGAWRPLAVMFDSVTIAGASGWIDSTQADKPINGTYPVRWQAIGR